MVTPPRLCVLIDTYNHERYIDAAIASVLAQRDVDIDGVDIVVVDDGSTDGTPARLAAYGERLRVLQKDNGGQASAFNAALPECRGDVVALLDGDDAWAPGKLRAVRDAFAADPSLVAVGHAIVEIDEHAGTRRVVAPRGPQRLVLDSVAAARQFRMHRAFLGTSRLAARRHALLRLLPVPTALVFEADEWLFTLLPTLGPVAILPDALTDYRLHGGNYFQARLALDDPRLARRAAVFECLRDELPAALRERGVAGDTAATVLDPVWIEASRLELLTRRGPARRLSQRAQAAAIERRVNADMYDHARGAYGLWRRAMPALAWLLPPRLLYRVRAAYSAGPWRRWRERVLRGGHTIPVTSRRL